MGVLASFGVHLVFIACITLSFSSMYAKDELITASFVEFVELMAESSNVEISKSQQALAVKDSSKLQLQKSSVTQQTQIKEFHRADQRASLKSDILQRAVSESEGTAARTSTRPSHAVEGVGFNAAKNIGLVRATLNDLIFSRLERFKRYPPRALQRHLEGDVLLGLTLSKTGEVVESYIKTSSGFDFFDKEVLEMAKRADPFPVPSQLAENTPLAFEIPISFKLY